MLMYNRESILKSLNTENYYIDRHSLDLFLEDWHIESIYEDESGLEFYDELALEKIKKGISLKAQSFTDEQIIAKLAKIEAKVEKYPEPPKPMRRMGEVFSFLSFISPSSRFPTFRAMRRHQTEIQDFTSSVTAPLFLALFSTLSTRFSPQTAAGLRLEIARQKRQTHPTCHTCPQTEAGARADPSNPGRRICPTCHTCLQTVAGL